MDSEPTSTQAPAPAPAPAPVSTETLSNLAPVITPVTEPHAATNKEDIIPTNDIPNAKEAPNKQENETDENVRLNRSMLQVLAWTDDDTRISKMTLKTKNLMIRRPSLHKLHLWTEKRL